MLRAHHFQSKNEYTYRVLREEILSGTLQPDTRLVIDDISLRLGVSAIPIREALQRLQSEGLVAIEPYVGARVTKIHAGLIHEIFELLEATEVISSRAACRHMTEQDFADVEDLLGQMDTCADDVEQWSHLNVTLHQLICERADTQLVQKTMLRVLDHWNRLRRYYLTEVSAQRIENAQRDHWQILAALRSREPAHVERIVRRHNQEALADYLRYLQQQGHLDVAGHQQAG